MAQKLVPALPALVLVPGLAEDADDSVAFLTVASLLVLSGGHKFLPSSKLLDKNLLAADLPNPFSEYDADKFREGNDVTEDACVQRHRPGSAPRRSARTGLCLVGPW